MNRDLEILYFEAEDYWKMNVEKENLELKAQLYSTQAQVLQMQLEKLEVMYKEVTTQLEKLNESGQQQVS
jgi:prefoldin subunit 5